MRILSLVSIVLASTILSSCAVGKVVTAPIRAAGTVVETAVDATTQTQSEKEEDAGRKVLAERKKQRKECLKQAETKEERRYCKEQYSDDF